MIHNIQHLVIDPLTRQSVAMQVSSVVQTVSPETRFPIVATDPTNSWVAEGDEIPASTPDVEELTVTPKKCAGLTVVSTELAQDSNPSALTVVGNGLVRDLQVRVDAAYFGTTVTNGPDGIANLAGAQTVDAGSAFTNLDPFAEALSKAETVDLSLNRAFVAHPSTLLALSQLKIGTDWNLPLLGADPSSPTKRSILGAPVFWSPAVDEETVWLITRMKSFVVIRMPVAVRVDESAYFTSDQVAIRATMRVGFGWPHPAAVVKISVGITNIVVTPSSASVTATAGSKHTTQLGRQRLCRPGCHRGSHLHQLGARGGHRLRGRPGDRRGGRFGDHHRHLQGVHGRTPARSPSPETARTLGG
jgi:HK97 family phage major capsid protein